MKVTHFFKIYYLLSTEEKQTGLEQHEDEQTMTEIPFLGELSLHMIYEDSYVQLKTCGAAAQGNRICYHGRTD